MSRAEDITRRGLSINIALCFLAAFLGTFAFRIQLPTISFYARDVLHASALVIGMFMSMFMIGRALSSLMTGFIYGYEKIVKYIPSLCFAFNSIIALIYMGVRSVEQIIALRTLQGILNGLAWVSIQIALGASTPKNLRGTVYAIYFALGTGGAALANYVYSIVSRYGVEVPLLISSVAFGITSIVALFVKYVQPRMEKPKISRETSRTTDKKSLLIALLAFIACLNLGASFTAGDVVYVYLREVYGISKEVVTRFMSISILLSIAISITLGRIADKVSDRQAIAIITAMSLLSLIAISVKNLVCAYLAIALLSTSIRSLVPIARRIAITFYGAKGIGFVNTVGNIASVFGNIIVGYVYDRFGTATLSVFNGLNFVASMAAVMPWLAIAVAFSSMLLLRALKES